MAHHTKDNENDHSSTPKKHSDSYIPYESTNFLSLMCFWWMTPLVTIGRKRPLTFNDIWKIPERDSYKYNTDIFERLWKEEIKLRGERKASIGRVIIKALMKKLLVSVAVYAIVIGCSISSAVSDRNDYTFFMTFQNHTIASKFMTLQAYMLSAHLQYKLIMRLIVEYSTSTDLPVERGVILVCSMLISEIVFTFFFALAWYVSLRTAIKARSMIFGLVFNKVISLKNTGGGSVGKLINLCANDAQRVYEAVLLLGFCLGAPVAIIGVITALVFTIGPVALVSLIVIFFYYGSMIAVGKVIKKLRRKSIVITDQRIREMNEVLKCIRLIKLYAWEESFETILKGKYFKKLRQSERSRLEKVAYIQSFNISFIMIIPALASVLTLTTGFLLGVPITSAQAFTSIALLNALRQTINMFPQMIRQSVEAVVAFKRIKQLLAMEEFKDNNEVLSDNDNAIIIKNGLFKWNTSNKKDDNSNNDACKPIHYANIKEILSNLKKFYLLESAYCNNGSFIAVDVQEFYLKDIKFQLKKGEISGICGRIGSGKSSLISAILGEMNTVSGSIAVGGSIGLVTQQPWIFNGTLRDNITFGYPFNAARYERVIECCSLQEDLIALPNGDETSIGDRGVNLSGGQKQRVSLARTVYADRDVYLFDDPLSAVDTDVGKHIFERCFNELLKEKSILFVTHQLQYLRDCDCVTLMKDGQIIGSGSHSELLNSNKVYADLISDLCNKKEDEIEDKKATLIDSSNGIIQTSAVEKNRETKESGEITWRTYKSYINFAGGNLVMVLVLMVYGITVSVRVFTDWWLSQWLSGDISRPNMNSTNNSSDFLPGPTTSTHSNTSFSSRPANQLPFYTNLAIYVSSAIIMILLQGVRAIAFSKVTLRASSKLCTKALHKILRCPLSFFDYTPSGRILNRFSRDMDEIDIQLPLFADRSLLLVLTLLGSIIVVLASYPWVAIAIVPLVLGISMLAYVFGKTLREVKRLESISRSPVMTHLTATMEGLSVIHAHGKSAEYLAKFRRLLDRNSSCTMIFMALNRWFAIRVDWFITVLVAIGAMTVVIERGLASSAYSGLALVYIMQTKGILQFAVRNILETNSRFTCVERLNEYCEDLPTENSDVKKTDVITDDNWIKNGEVEFREVKMRYRPHLPTVLDGIQFKINAGERIGIVGRTGSGKTSIGACLFRLVEIYSGSILIDGHNISHIDLYSLRRNMSMIPQDPFIFEGTIRTNLDPLNHYNDRELWRVLEKVQLKEKISQMRNTLHASVEAGGNNFSMGERQLLCMARAILKESKIVLLDEATAFMDTKTDGIIQATLQSELRKSTVLIIAHRLNTIQSCDKVLVLDSGKILEFDTPFNLMYKEESIFKRMVSKAGIEELFKPKRVTKRKPIILENSKQTLI
ncbi:Multidrug resistance-associated protein 5 [Trichoplax sp. H2]|nr:Multidrug resistance-associated protein 5 [Trichoplax sp. H2]|eukprot:RDD40705.1 Multidrug resistance-associated protein 5 [Trichoplax sp. H2]